MSLKTLDTAINNLESYINKDTALNPKISKATVGWHIDHSLKVINSVCLSLQKSEPNTFKNNFSVLGKVFFTLGFFPRGKAKAPKYVRPPEVILKEDLLQQMQLAKTNIKTLSNLDKDAYFKHPFFGNINQKRVPKFLTLHTKHHLKIIKEILQ
ncbi:DUF1569 domain-containing protein [Olleya aquimaris]|uniref:Uncharacterized protein DUF1569 n=1 Tax=Olleya aquimaris TaxID=639310 RepID=A0A327RHL9_9FLAO|nr:DUF1569 domain-containing protein [Olleya aquimaris]RAJ14953.1 uncharacterized protein DUF1569 [Olleya aquimaris]